MMLLRKHLESHAKPERPPQYTGVVDYSVDLFPQVPKPKIVDISSCYSPQDAIDHLVIWGDVYAHQSGIDQLVKSRTFVGACSIAACRASYHPQS